MTSMIKIWSLMVRVLLLLLELGSKSKDKHLSSIEKEALFPLKCGSQINSPQTHLKSPMLHSCVKGDKIFTFCTFNTDNLYTYYALQDL